MKKNIVFVLSLSYLGLSAQFFSKVTTSAISSNPADSRSVNWVDVNNDGNIDCFISNGPSGGQNNFLYLNAGGGVFNLVTGDLIVLDGKPSDGGTFADVNNDGLLDAFVVNWYNVNNLFYVNNGSGIFTKNNSTIISTDAGYSETAAWGDYDKDGLVDLYVTNSAGNRKNFLYHNDGNINFSKILSGAHVNDAFYSRSVNWTDIDNDGDLDLFVTNENLQNENLYRNDGIGMFTKLTTGPLLNDGGNTMSSSWADIDNDGDLDVFMANDQGYNSLFKNNGNFNFVKSTTDTVCKTPSRSFSSAWSDVDNDGDLDLFVTNSFKNGSLLVNYFYLNDGAGNFMRNNTDAVVQDSAWYYGCAFGDYDNDGFEDLAVATCRYNGIDETDFLYRNNGNGNKWVTVKLVGTASNKAAIGTKIRVKAVINGLPVWQMREISSQSSYCGQNDMRAHFGLGNATTIDSLKIEWPLGLVEHYTNVGVNQFITYVEGPSNVGLNENPDLNPGELLVYPNPSVGILSVSFGSRGFLSGDKISICNTEGKELMSIKPVTTNTIKLDLKSRDIKIGNYLLLLQSKEGKTITKKIVIN